MVADSGFQEIVYFAEIRPGEAFASTRTGCHYEKTATNTWLFVENGRHHDHDCCDEQFEPTTLVYRYPPMDERAL